MAMYINAYSPALTTTTTKRHFVPQVQHTPHVSFSSSLRIRTGDVLAGILIGSVMLAVNSGVVRLQQATTPQNSKQTKVIVHKQPKPVTANKPEYRPAIKDGSLPAWKTWTPPPKVITPVEEASEPPYKAKSAPLKQAKGSRRSRVS